ncbi:probable 26S proteasome regulatory subunit p27 [Trichomonascus vanleenenianus]|uniref:Nas2p n=1 Tax=Trichomonascus vanleenenianus TaxID=2268995 RepID=UPI003ECB7686
MAVEYRGSTELDELITRRYSLEAELEGLSGVLRVNNCDMETLLVTADGFPRADIDVVEVRKARTEIIRLRNDLKSLMSVIETKLHEFFKANQDMAPLHLKENHEEIEQERQQEADESMDIDESSPQAVSVAAAFSDDITTADFVVAFAMVDDVTVDSPAHQAGLLVGDRIVKFGDVHAGNHGRLSKLAVVVRENDGKEIDVIVLRDQRITVKLVPNSSWEGRGSLGCHMIPI